MVGIQWSREHGRRGASLVEQIVFAEEMARARAPGILDPVSVNIVGPTLIRFGTPAQRARWLLAIPPADEVWCLRFSESQAACDAAIATCSRRGSLVPNRASEVILPGSGRTRGDPGLVRRHLAQGAEVEVPEGFCATV